MNNSAATTFPKWACVDEANPGTWKFPAGITQVRLNCSVPQNAKTEKLIARMARDTRWHEVKSIVVEYDSMFQTMNWMAYFPKLVDLHLQGNNLSDFEAMPGANRLTHLAIDLKKPPRSLATILPKLNIQNLWVSVGTRSWLAEAVGQIAGLDELVVYRWPDDDLSRFKQPIERHLTVGQSRITTTEGLSGDGIKSLDVVHCKRFREFAPTQAIFCTIASCPDVDYTSLGKIMGLRSLMIQSQPPIHSVANLLVCKRLHELCITATRLQADDLDLLAQLPELAFFWASPSLTVAQAQRLSQAKRDLIVTNGDVCYKDGNVVDLHQVYYKTPRAADVRL
ncbi:hypothetical protein HED60_01035 [Planctomycetales bacterium ZRK34]|nr:hypothetical protein HED60_01035 [Planctomycetales bacterium ZRK34]